MASRFEPSSGCPVSVTVSQPFPSGTPSFRRRVALCVEIVDDDVDVSIAVVIEVGRRPRVPEQIGATSLGSIFERTVLVHEQHVRLLLTKIGSELRVSVVGGVVYGVLDVTVHDVEIVVRVVIEVEEVRIPRPSGRAKPALNEIRQDVVAQPAETRRRKEQMIGFDDAHRPQVVGVELHRSVRRGQDILLIFRHREDVGDVEVGKAVAVEIGRPHVH